MKWTAAMQARAETMAACGVSVRQASQLLGVDSMTVMNHLVPAQAERNRRRAKEWHYANRERAKAASKAHYAANVELYIWQGMIRRCTNPSDVGYPRYGGRGIKVCKRWRLSFDAFLKDVGCRPSPDHSIDRIDNDGDYKPGNVRWATHQEQCLNKSNNLWVEIDGAIVRLAEGARLVGEKYGTARARVVRGTHPRLRRVRNRRGRV